MQSTKSQKDTLRPNNLHHFVSVAEIAVVIRLRLGETRKSGKMQTSANITCPIIVCIFAEIQSFLRQVLARHGRNTLAQTYRGMHMNSDVLMRENAADKKCTNADRPLDNHVVYIRTS